MRLAEMIHAHRLELVGPGDGPQAAKERRRRRPAPERPSDDPEVSYAPFEKVKYPKYYPSIAAMHTWCRGGCGVAVFPGQSVMRRVVHGVIEYMHEGCYRYS